MHGEHKTPNGKLVVVDLEVHDGRLADVVVSGDFFLDPDEALDAIAAAIEGAPADTDEPGLAERVRRALGPEVEMVGFTPASVAAAVRSAFR
jgi:lipoate-protein ligase A